MAEVGVCESLLCAAREYRLVKGMGAIAPGEAHHQPFMNLCCVALADLFVAGFHYVGAESRGRRRARRKEVCKI
jgi:hypothetical protein